MTPVEMNLLATRTCRVCSDTKDSAEFVKNKAYSHGIDTICLSCSREKVRQWKQQNREKHSTARKRYATKYPEKVRAKANKRRAVKLQAMPSWANEFFIEEAYHLAHLRTKMTGFTWHVDHVIPLQNNLVCGLHVETNLQVIPATLNWIKGNDYNGTGKHWTTNGY